MIAPFRTAIWALGSGSILIAAIALSRDPLPRRPFVVDGEPRGAYAGWDHPAPTADRVADESDASRAAAAKGGRSVPPPSSVQTPHKPSAVFQNASLRSTPGAGGPPVQLGPLVPAPSAGNDAIARTSRPVVVLKPEMRSVARREKAAPAATQAQSAVFVTRLYRPNATSASDLERLIRPLLTAGTGTATANTAAAGDSADPRPDVLLVRDRPEVVSQIDAIYADLEAAPKRVVIDALIADVALPDSTPPGWENRTVAFRRDRSGAADRLELAPRTGSRARDRDQSAPGDRPSMGLPRMDPGAASQSAGRAIGRRGRLPAPGDEASASGRRSCPAAWSDWKCIRRRAGGKRDVFAAAGDRDFDLHNRPRAACRGHGAHRRHARRAAAAEGEPAARFRQERARRPADAPKISPRPGRSPPDRAAADAAGRRRELSANPPSSGSPSRGWRSASEFARIDGLFFAGARPQTREANG